MVLLICFCFAPALGYSQNDIARQAETLMQAGRFHEAEDLWRKLTESEPRNASAHANLGLALARQEQLAAAAVEYRKALAIQPNQPTLSFDLGLAEFKQGHFAKAIPAFKSAGAATTDQRIPVLVGMSYFGLHQYGDAVPYLEIASTADPGNLEIHNVLAKSCLWSKRYDCALGQFKEILRVNPDAVQAHMLLAEALDAMSRKADAISELEAAERTSPNEPMLHFELGYLYYTQHNYEKAQQEFELEIKNNPKYALAYTYLGDIALHHNDHIAAESFLTEALHLQDDVRLTYFDLGCVYADQKRNQEALAAFLRAEHLDPSEPDAHYRLARLYLALGQKEKANEQFAKTKALHAKVEESLIQKVSGGGLAEPKPNE
jgi:tetratricopeptide (TPR) repeat protein